MCILITAVDGGGRLFGVSWMSSNDDRISNVICRIIRWYCGIKGYFAASTIGDRRRGSK